MIWRYLYLRKPPYMVTVHTEQQIICKQTHLNCPITYFSRQTLTMRLHCLQHDVSIILLSPTRILK